LFGKGAKDGATPEAGGGGRAGFGNLGGSGGGGGGGGWNWGGEKGGDEGQGGEESRVLTLMKTALLYQLVVVLAVTTS
jgi:hypothetical protein